MKLWSASRLGRHKWVAAGLVLAVGFGGAHTACLGPEATAGTLLTGSTQGTTDGEDWAIGLAVGLLVAAAVGVVTFAMEDDLSLYIEEHRIDIERAVARGDGLFVRDLAALLGVGEQGAAAVGAALQAGHREIAAVLADPSPLGSARVEALGVAVRRAIVASPQLAPYAAEEALTLRLRELGVL